MIVYHGTDSISAQNIIDNGIDVKYGEESVDNALGFYTTPNIAFAIQRAQTMAARKKEFYQNEDVKPAVLQIEVDFDESTELRIKRFEGCTREWREFVLYNRLGKRFLKKWGIVSENHNLDFKYDIVVDETADTGINDLVSKVRYTKTVPDFETLIAQIDKSDNPNWDRQISFHSGEAIKLSVRSIQIADI